MTYSKNPNSYSSTFHTLYELLHTTDKTKHSLQFKTQQEAIAFRLKFYSFIRVKRADNLRVAHVFPEESREEEKRLRAVQAFKVTVEDNKVLFSNRDCEEEEILSQILLQLTQQEPTKQEPTKPANIDQLMMEKFTKEYTEQSPETSNEVSNEVNPISNTNSDTDPTLALFESILRKLHNRDEFHISYQSVDLAQNCQTKFTEFLATTKLVRPSNLCSEVVGNSVRVFRKK